MPSDVQSPTAIELRVENTDRLFDPFDPFPTPTRDLAKSVEDFIVGWARELPPHAEATLILHVEDGDARENEVKQAIANHFTARADATRRDLDSLFRIGRTSLLIGVAVLLACVLASTLVGQMMSGALGRFLSEGLFIIGWVANWRPIEIFLYEWWPIENRRRLFQRLAAARIDLRGAAA